jgi:hypothetical protein
VTAQQDLNALLVFGPMSVTFVGELALVFARPDLLAHLAYLPIGRSRRVLLEPAVRAALAPGGSYRDRSKGELDLTPLASTRELAVGAKRVQLDADGRRATFRLPLGRMFALSGACRVALIPDRDGVTLRASLMPTMAPTCLALFLPLLVMALLDGSPETRIVVPVFLVVLLLFQGVGALRCRADFRGDVDEVLDALEARLTALS